MDTFETKIFDTTKPNFDTKLDKFLNDGIGKYKTFEYNRNVVGYVMCGTDLIVTIRIWDVYKKYNGNS